MASTQIIKAKKSLTTASKLREDTQMIMQPYANWEEHLTPAPLSITVLGELIFISSKDDFSINQNPPKDGFQFIKYPNSFRACLMQVCNAGWYAFNEAHTSMDQIRLHTANVPQYVRTATEVILKNDERLFQAVLPDTLANIDNIASECMRLSSCTKDRFEMVISLVHEILEASTSAKEVYTEDLKNVTQKMEENEVRKESKMETDKRTAEDLKNYKSKLDAAEKLFDKAMKSMPSGWDMIGMNLVEGLAESLNTLVSGLTNVATLKFEQMVGGGVMGGMGGMRGKGGKGGSAPNTGTKQGEAGFIQGKEQMDEYFAVKEVYQQSSTILKLAEIMKHLTAESKIDWADLYDQKHQKPKSDFTKEMLEEVKNSITSLKGTNAKNTALEICGKGISICTEMASIAPKGECEASKEQQLIEEIAKLHEQAQTFNAKGKQVTKTTPFSQTPPGLAQAQGKKSAATFAAENARVQIEETRKALDTARQMYSTAVERFEKNKEELTEILVTLKNCDIKKIDFKTTLEILAQGLTALGKVKEQWEKMVRFFQIVSTIIKASMNTAMKSFTGTAKQASEYSSSAFLKDMVYSQAFQVSNVASLVNMISSTYTEVSEKYIMDRVSSLGRLMALDQNSPEFDVERKQLQDGCVEAQRGILALVQKNKTDFNLKTEERMVHLDELRALLPPPTKEEEEKVKRIVNSPSEDVDQFI